MSDGRTNTRRIAMSSGQLHTSRTQTTTAAGGADRGSDGLDIAESRATASSTGTPSSVGDDEPPSSATTEHRMRKSCDYCVRMKRACDGKTPCALCTRRNKECTRSVKKKSGPAKGTKYAARRTRSHDELQRSGYGGGGKAESSSHLAPAGMRRTASSGDSRWPPPSLSLGAMGPSRTHRPASHASPRIAHRTTFPPGGFRLVPPGVTVSGIGRDVERDGGASEGAGIMAVGGVRGGGDDKGRGVGVVGRSSEEFTNRHHQLGGGRGGGSGGNDSESQQLIKNFPGVLQDPSIWSSPSPEELRIVRDLEPDSFSHPMTTNLVGPSQPIDSRPVAARYPCSYGEEIDGRAVARAWDVVATDGGDLVDRARATGGETAAGMQGSGKARGEARHERCGSSDGAGGSVDDSGIVGSLPFEWAPRLSPQQYRRGGGSGGGGGDGDQPHYFPRAMQQSQRQQQRGHHPVAKHDVIASGGSKVLPSSTSVGQSAHSNLPPLGKFERSAYHGSGLPESVAGDVETVPGFSSIDKGAGVAIKTESGFNFSSPRLGVSDQARDHSLSGDPQLQLQQQRRHNQYRLHQTRHHSLSQLHQLRRQQQQQDDARRWHQMPPQGEDQPSLSSVLHPSIISHGASHPPEDGSSRLFSPLPPQEAPRRTSSLDSSLPNVDGLAVDTATTATGVVVQTPSLSHDFGWERPVRLGWGSQGGGGAGDARSLEAHAAQRGASNEGRDVRIRHVSDFGVRRQPGAHDDQR